MLILGKLDIVSRGILDCSCQTPIEITESIQSISDNTIIRMLTDDDEDDMDSNGKERKSKHVKIIPRKVGAKKM